MMQEETFYSVRMRASMNGSHEDGGKHISGGERLIPFHEMKHTVNALLEKGLSHSRGKPDFMQIQFEEVHESIKPFSHCLCIRMKWAARKKDKSLPDCYWKKKAFHETWLKKHMNKSLNGQMSGCGVVWYSYRQANGSNKRKGCGSPEWIGRTLILKNGRFTVTCQLIQE